jgi:hypothetical protein
VALSPSTLSPLLVPHFSSNAARNQQSSSEDSLITHAHSRPTANFQFDRCSVVNRRCRRSITRTAQPPPTPAAAQAAPTNTAAACARLPSPSLRGAARRCFDLWRQKKQLLASLKLISLLSHTSTMAEGEPCFPLHNNLPPCEKQPIQPRFARLGLPYVFTKPPHHLLIHDLPITSRITFFNFVCSRSRPPRPRPLRLLCRRRNFCSLPPFRFLQRHLRPHH